MALRLKRDPNETDEQYEARKRAWIRDYRRERRAAGHDRAGEYVPASPPARMVLTPWTVEPNGVMSRELRGV
jgi:hypothetical protein